MPFSQTSEFQRQRREYFPFPFLPQFAFIISFLFFRKQVLSYVNRFDSLSYENTKCVLIQRYEFCVVLYTVNVLILILGIDISFNFDRTIVTNTE